MTAESSQYVLRVVLSREAASSRELVDDDRTWVSTKHKALCYTFSFGTTRILRSMGSRLTRNEDEEVSIETHGSRRCWVRDSTHALQTKNLVRAGFSDSA